MSVHFNYFEELSENKFFLKHLDQTELYLVIEYNSQPTLFLSTHSSQSFKIEGQAFQFKFIKNYTPLSKKIAEKNPMPWGAYILTFQKWNHTYHFVYEILDPQGQSFFISQFEKLENEKTSQTPDDFMKTRLYIAYQNVFSHEGSFGELKTAAIKNLKLLPSGKDIALSNACFRFPLALGDPFQFSAELEVHEVNLFLDHFEKSLIPEKNQLTLRYSKTEESDQMLTHLKPQQRFLFDAGKLTSYLSQELEILSKTGDIFKKYRLLIRNGREREKIWDSSPPPFAKLSSLRWENIPSLVHKNMLEAYHEDYGLFWGVTDEPHAPLHYQSKKDNLFVYFLPLNFYYALTLQRLQWKDPPFQNYIDSSLKIASSGYYLYEDDPRYSEWFHKYYVNQMSPNEVMIKLKDKLDEFSLKPISIWSSIDAVLCLNACSIFQKEKNDPFSRLALDFLRHFENRLTTEPKATAYQARDKDKKVVYTCSPHGFAVLAMFKGFELFKEESFKNKAKEQLEFLLKTYPIEEQTFVLGRYDYSALVNTTAALQRATRYFSEYKKILEKAKGRILEEWVKRSPFLPLSTQLEVTNLTTTGFYYYF